MDEKDNVVKNFLSEFSNETENPFENNVKDPFSQEETVKEDVKEEKAVPYHKDPKLQKYLDKREKEIEERIKSSMTAEPKEKYEEEDDFFTRLIGDDTPEKVALVKEYKAREARILDQAEERAFNRLTKEQKAQIESEKQDIAELENAFETIEENYGVDISSNTTSAKKTRQEFVSFVERIAPKDKNGEISEYPDMASAWETFQDIQKSKQTPSRAKELASRSMARSNEVSSVPTERINWDSVDKALGL